MITLIYAKENLVKDQHNYVTMHVIINLKLNIKFIFLDELFKVHKLKPSEKWRSQFDTYLKTMPSYYAGVSLSYLFYI